MCNQEEGQELAVNLNKKYTDLKAKLDKISSKSPILKGEGTMVELDPNNEQHKEWFYDEYKEES